MDCPEALDLAVQAGECLTKTAQPTSLGLRFPELSSQGKVEYWHNLYQGAAGVGIALLDLFVATGDKSFSNLASDIAYDLIESAAHQKSIHPGLFSGHTGIALFHLNAGRILNEPLLLREAFRLGDQLAGKFFHGTDLVSGAAGTGLFFLSLHNATQEERFIRAAQRAVDFLKETSEVQGNSICWAPLIPEWGENAARFSPHTGLAHGVAGICLFLLEMVSAQRKDLPEALCQGGFNWLEKHMVQKDTGYYWPVSLYDSKNRYHWCHGSAGIAQAFLSFYKHSQKQKALDFAIDAGKAALYLLKNQSQEPLFHCHGLSGILELFLDLEHHDKKGDWGRTAAGYLPIFANSFNSRKSKHSSWTQRTSLALGSAGIIRFLLRLGGKPNIPILTALKEPIELSAFEGGREFILPFPVSESSNAESRNEPLLSDHLGDLLPKMALRLQKKNFQVIPKSQNSDAKKNIYESFVRHPRSKRYLRILKKLQQTSSQLEREYSLVIKRGVLDIRLHGPFLREIAGISLFHPDEDSFSDDIISRMTAQYIDMLELFFFRLSRDFDGVLAKDRGGRLIQMEILRSDPHRHGQRIIALKFEGGQELIYKSRSVALERVLLGCSGSGGSPSLVEKCNQWLNPAVPGARLSTLRIIQGGNHYGYAERIRTQLEPIEYIDPRDLNHFGYPIEPIPVRATILKKENESKFWYSAGLLAGFAMGNGLSDLHSENLICGISSSTNDPEFFLIDVEHGFFEYDCLRDTLLVDLTRIEEPEAYARGIHKHSGFDNEIKMCGSSGEPWIFLPDEEGFRLLPGSPNVIEPDFANLAKNQDGSIGYASYLCWFVKGQVDIWDTMRNHKEEISVYMREKLENMPVRVIAKATRLYTLWQRKFRARAYPSSGASWSSEFFLPHSMAEVEMNQLKEGDVPYFFRYLDSQTPSPSSIRWFDSPPLGDGIQTKLDKVYLGPDRFWTIAERQSHIDVLLRSLADAITFVAPEGPFDTREDNLGIRVFRPPGEEKIWFVVLLPSMRLTCRIEGGGSISKWID